MPPTLVAYLDYRTLNGGKPSTLEQLREGLRRLPRNAVVRLCCAMNSLVATWVGEQDMEVQTNLIRGAFPPERASQILSTGRPVFHRQQLLFTIKEALRWSVKSDEPITRPFWDGLGEVLLMANDHLHVAMVERTEFSDKAAEVVVSTVPVLEANNATSYLTRMARSYLTLSRFVEPLRGTANFFDVRSLFEKATKVPLEVYQSLLWGSISRVANVEKLRKSVDLADFAIPRKWFATTKISEAQIESFLADISASLDELGRLTQKESKPNDFTLLKDHPVIDDLEHFLPIDFTFLTDKLESGVFWRVHNHLDSKDKEKFHAFWGVVFEKYMNWVFTQASNGKSNRFLPDPRFRSNTNEQVCDGLILCDRTAVLMEYKGSTFTARTKYGGDADCFKTEVESKLVGTPQKRKGIRQLAEAVDKLCRPDNPDAIDGVDMTEVTVIFPLLITRDDIGSAWGMNAYLNSRFQELISGMRRLRPVTSLFCMSADDIEKLSPFLADTSLAKTLSARHKAEKPLMASFWMVDNKFLRRKGTRKPTIAMDATKELTQLTLRTLGLKADESASGPSPQKSC
jgi:hypothetical protein